MGFGDCQKWSRRPNASTHFGLYTYLNNATLPSSHEFDQSLIVRYGCVRDLDACEGSTFSMTCYSFEWYLG